MKHENLKNKLLCKEAQFLTINSVLENCGKDFMKFLLIAKELSREPFTVCNIELKCEAEDDGMLDEDDIIEQNLLIE